MALLALPTGGGLTTRQLGWGFRPLTVNRFLDYARVAMITTVTGKNQIKIPAELARQLQIEPGTSVDWSIGPEGELLARVIPPRAALARQLAGVGRAWLPPGTDPVADLLRERDRR